MSTNPAAEPPEDLATIIELAGTVCRTHLGGDVPKDVLDDKARPYAVLYAAAGSPLDGFLCGTSPFRQSVHQLMAVSTDQNAVIRLARRLTDRLHGARVGPGLLSVDLVGPPLRDPDDPEHPRWSSTLEIRHHR